LAVARREGEIKCLQRSGDYGKRRAKARPSGSATSAFSVLRRKI
jgi:hypothetical protein